MGRELKIATYNVNSVRSRLPIIIPWLETNRPDVLCLQETKVRNEAFPQDAFTASGYKVFFSGSGGYNGVAIASCEEPQKVSIGFIDDGKESDRLLIAHFENFTIITIYVPQGREKDSPHFTYKLEWFTRFLKMLEDDFSPLEPLLVCGDMNVAPEAIDVHDPLRLRGHVCFTPEVWEAYAYWQDWGLKDVFRKFYPKVGGLYSFFDYRAINAVEKGLGWRIDHILATEPLYEKATAVSIDLEPRLAAKPSDHTPVIATFTL